MEILGWVQVGASLIVGLGASALTNLFAKQRRIEERADTRRLALLDYQKALFDKSCHLESSAADGLGAHPAPDPKAIELARAAAFPYFSEFEGHDLAFEIKSPYYEHLAPHNGRMEESFFISKIEKVLQDHLLAYPKPLSKSPYVKEEK